MRNFSPPKLATTAPNERIVTRLVNVISKVEP